MPQQINDALANADCSPQGLDGGLNLKGDPTRLSPPATTRSDNAHYDTVGSVSQMPGFVSQGLNGARHVYNLHARDAGVPSQNGDVLLHGEFPDGNLGYTSSFWSLANSSFQFSDQPVLPFSLKMRNIAGRLVAATDYTSTPSASYTPLSFARQEVLPVNGRRKFAMMYTIPSVTANNGYFNISVGYMDGLCETQTLQIEPTTNSSGYWDCTGIQSTNYFAFCGPSSTANALDLWRVDFDTLNANRLTINGVTLTINSSIPYQFFQHAGRTFLAYYTNASTPLLNFYDCVAAQNYTTPIGGTLTPGFAVFSPYSHQNVTGAQYLVVIKNNNAYVLSRLTNTQNFSLVGGAVPLPASSNPQASNTAIHCTGTAMINDNQGGVGGNAKLLITVFRTLPEKYTLQFTSRVAGITSVAVDQLTFTANNVPLSFGLITLVSTSVARFPAGAIICAKAFNSCPSESNYAGIASSKQALCLVRSNAYEAAPNYAGGGVSAYSYGQPTYFILDHKARIVGRFLESAAPSDGSDKSDQPSVSNLSNPLFHIPTDQTDDLSALNITLPAWSLIAGAFQPPVTVSSCPYYSLPPVDTVYAPTAVTLSLANTGQSVPAVQGGPYTVFSGALTACHDGFQTAESNYHFAAPNPHPVAYTSGTVLGGSGTYTYVVVHEFIDAQGQVVRSQPSKPASIYCATSFFGATVMVPKVPTSKQTVYPNKVRVKLYRSLKGGKLDGNFYYVNQSLYSGDNDSSSVNFSVGSNVIYDNQIVDNAALSATDPPPPANAINAQPRLYTGLSANDPGAVFPATPPPSFFYQTASKNRLFGLTQQVGQFRIYYTGQASGTTAPEWNSFNYMPIPPDIGEVRSIEALDAAVVIFGTRYVATLTGDGPASNNVYGKPSPGEGFNPILPVPTPAGVLGTGSPTRIPEGLVYQSQSGIQMYDRGSIVNPIGAVVDVFTGRQLGNPGQILGRGIMLPALQSVVWPNVKGPALVYCYLTKKFSLWPLLSNAVALVQRMDGNVYAALQPVVNNVFQGPATSGNIGCEYGILSASSYAPVNQAAAANAALVLETPWILPTGASGGEARVWNVCLTGTWLGPHTLQVEQAYNYEPYSLTRTVDMSVAPRQYQAIIQPLSNTRMVSVRYRISLLPLTTLQAGFPMATLADLVLFSAKQQGTARSSAALRG